MSPINISFHTTDPELRCKMLGNRFAGEALLKVERLIALDPQIVLNGQIVLCKGINDGERLERTLNDLTKYIPNLQSVSVVPVGLTKFRQGLYPLAPFDKIDAARVIDTVEEVQGRIMKSCGMHFVHASDEWYLMAERDLPDEDSYDGYPQLENGVGMLRLLMDSFEEALGAAVKQGLRPTIGEISCVTGKLSHKTVCGLLDRLCNEYPDLRIHLYEIKNEFFGENITVTGLLTGQDIISQLESKPLGDRLLIPANALRAGEAVFLDDVTTDDVAKALGVEVCPFDVSGEGTLMAFLGRKTRNKNQGYEVDI